MTFKDGKVTPIEESHLQFDADYFSKHKTAPLQREDFPKNIHCLRACVTRSCSTCGTSTRRKSSSTTRSRRKSSWLVSCRRSTWIASTSGEVGARNNAVTHTRTSAPLSGKSTAATTGQALIGMHGERNQRRRDKAGIIDRQSLFSNLLLVIDDMIPTEKDDGQRNSRQYQQLIRAQFDRTTRVVSGKARTSRRKS